MQELLTIVVTHCDVYIRNIFTENNNFYPLVIMSLYEIIIKFQTYDMIECAKTIITIKQKICILYY